MSSPDKNLESYAGAAGLVITGPRTIDGRGYDDALKFSNCTDVAVRNLDIIGGGEDCIDVNRGRGYAFTDLRLRPTGRYAITLKAAEGVAIKRVVLVGHGKVADIDIGSWSDQSGERTRGVDIDDISCEDGSPVIIRVLHGELPRIANSRYKIKDWRWLAYLYRLAKRWHLA